jgi:putative ABC transport system permease protein
VLLQPLPYQQPGQLVRLYQGDVSEAAPRGFVTPVHYLAYRQRMSSFENVSAIVTYSENGADIGTGDQVRRIRVLQSSADYTDVMRVHPMLGRGIQSGDETGPVQTTSATFAAAPVVVLSYKLWTDQFKSDESIVGRAITMNGQPFTVVGVMPAGFVDQVAGDVDAWVPLNLTPGKDLSNADNHYVSVIARLKPGKTIASAQAELDGLMLALEKELPNTKGARARLYPLKEDIVGNSSRSLEIMLGAVGLVLLLVCVNIANLLLVRGSERAREFALRSALGAERTRLVRQMLVESITLALAGDVAGLIVARVAMSAIVALGQGTIPRLATLSLDWPLLAFSLVIATASAVIFGMAPALRAARTQPGDVLREETRSSTGGAGGMRLREWLVVSQVALAFVLMVGAGLLLSSFQRIRGIDLGIKPSSVLAFEVHLPDARYDSTARATFYEEFARQLETLPGVRAAGGISKLPSTGQFNQWGTNALTGPLANTKQGSFSAEQRVISGDYFRAVGIPVLAGRTFDAHDDRDAPQRVVVSKAFADRAFPKTSAIGQRIKTGGREAEIIGVVGDVSINNEGGRDTYVYHAHRQFASDRNWALDQVVSFASGQAAPQEAIRRTLSAMDPQLVMYRPALLDDVIGRGAAQRVFTLRILMAFAGVAIALSALGLFGVLSYGVRLRSREFGIRMALGAEQGAIRRMVLLRGLSVTGVGIAIGLAGAVVTAKLMASVLFQVSPLDPTVLAAAIVLMALVAGVAAYLPARRATGVTPRTVLQ